MTKLAEVEALGQERAFERAHAVRMLACDVPQEVAWPPPSGSHRTLGFLDR